MVAIDFLKSKLWDLVDDVSKINKKGCPKCLGKCELIRFKNDRIYYGCKKM